MRVCVSASSSPLLILPFLPTAIFFPLSLFLFIILPSEISSIFLSFSFALSPPDSLLMTLCCYNPSILFVSLFTINSPSMSLPFFTSSFPNFVIRCLRFRGHVLFANVFFPFRFLKLFSKLTFMKSGISSIPPLSPSPPFSLLLSSDRKQTLTRPPLGTQRLFRHSVLQARTT